jgi:hypothetical protein
LGVAGESVGGLIERGSDWRSHDEKDSESRFIRGRYDHLLRVHNKRQRSVTEILKLTSLRF